MRSLRVLGGVVAVVTAAGVVGVLVADRDGGGAGAQSVAVPAGASGDGRVVISVGETDAPATLDVYEDFRCPACGRFEERYSRTIGTLVEQGKARVDYHLASFIDGNVGGTGSKYAANAAACAQDHGGFAEYHDVLYAEQPPETEDGFGQKDRLIELAQKVPELKANKEFDTCVDDGMYDGWVSRSQEAFNESGFSSTPTVLLDGEDIFADPKNPLTPKKLAAKVRAAAARKGKADAAVPESAGPSAGAGTAGPSGPAGTPGAPGSAGGATAEPSASGRGDSAVAPGVAGTGYAGAGGAGGAAPGVGGTPAGTDGTASGGASGRASAGTAQGAATPP